MNLQNFNFKINHIIYKTLLAVAICILVAYATGNHNVIFFGGVAAIVCMQHNYENTLKSGAYHFLGTLIGGFMGILTILVCILVPTHFIILNSITIAIASIIAIYLCNFLRLSSSTFINCVVFLAIVANYAGSSEIQESFIYMSERVLYTALGIGVATFINLAIHIHKNNYKAPDVGSKIIKRIKNHKFTLDYSLGLRAFKTALAIFISAVIAYLFNNMEAIFFCGVAVATCMQRDYKKSIASGLYNFIGTFCGGVMGFLIVELCNYATKYSYALEFFLILLAVFLVLYFCSLFNVQEMTPITYTILLRMVSRYGGLETNDNMMKFLLSPVLLFTFIGIAVAIVVNVFPFRKIDAFFKSKFIKSSEECQE